MTAAEGLQRAPLLKDFGPPGIEALAAAVAPRTLAAGEALFREDEEGDALFVVTSGQVRLSQRDAGGVERELCTVGPGAQLGDLAVLAHSVRQVTAVAVTPCEVLRLARRDFFKLAQAKPVTCLKLAAAIAGALARGAEENRRALRSLLAPAKS